MAADEPVVQVGRIMKSNVFEQEVQGTAPQRAESKKQQKNAGIIGFFLPFVLMAGALLAKGYSWPPPVSMLFWMGTLAILGAVFALIAGLLSDRGRAQNPVPYHFFSAFAAVAPIALLIAAFFGFEFKLPS